MHRLLAAVGVSLLSLTCALWGGAAHAGDGRTFHTVLTFHHSKVQMCRAPHKMFWYQIDNTASDKKAHLRYREVTNGVYVGGGPIPIVAAGAVSKNVGGTNQFPSATVAHIRLWHGGMLKRGTVGLSSVKPC